MYYSTYIHDIADSKQTPDRDATTELDQKKGKAQRECGENGNR